LLSGLGQNQGTELSGGQIKFVPVLADTGVGCAEIRINIAAQMQSRTARPVVFFIGEYPFCSFHSLRPESVLSSNPSRSHQRAEIIFIQIKDSIKGKAALLQSPFPKKEFCFIRFMIKGQGQIFWRPSASRPPPPFQRTTQNEPIPKY
jgi:hypothetical protein